MPSLPDVALLNRVNGYVTAIGSEQTKVMTELLASDPGMYVWSKGVAIGILDPATYNPRLYALQISKRIRPAVSLNAPDRDVDRFSFARLFASADRTLRFLVDVLSDDNYENDFEIVENAYAPPPKSSANL